MRLSSRKYVRINTLMLLQAFFMVLPLRYYNLFSQVNNPNSRTPKSLTELKQEAFDLGADGVLAVDLDYQEFSGQGKGMLFLVASGTAVKFKK